MMRGSLRARGVIVTRQRVIDSIGRVDPVSLVIRRRTTTYRRHYSVPTPNSLWYEIHKYKHIAYTIMSP